MEKRGLFIVFEGIDGCGKSTQARKFADYLFSKDKHYHVVFTRNPYKNINIRAILREDDNPMSEAEKLAELFITDRELHAKEIIIPNIKIGCHVVSDRYKLSTICYQMSQGMDVNFLIEKQKFLPVPDITFIVDLPAVIAGERMKQEAERKEHKFEANLDFLEKVRQNYIKMKSILPDEKIFVIDGNRDKEIIFEEIKQIFELVMQ